MNVDVTIPLSSRSFVLSFFFLPLIENRRHAVLRILLSNLEFQPNDGSERNLGGFIGLF